MMFYLVCTKSHSKTVPHYGTYIKLFRQIIKLQGQTEYHNGGCVITKRLTVQQIWLHGIVELFLFIGETINKKTDRVVK